MPYGHGTLAATGTGALVIGGLVLPLWVVASCAVLVGVGLLGTRFYTRRHR
jgi:hypothetical protein